MKKFTEYLNEQSLKFGNETRPNYGHVIVLAGGAGVGKGAVVKNLLAFPTAKLMNPDVFKKRVAMLDTEIKKMREKFGKLPDSEVLFEPVKLGDSDYLNRLKQFINANKGNTSFDRVAKTLITNLQSSKSFRDTLIKKMPEMVKSANPTMSKQEREEKVNAYTELLKGDIDLGNQETVGLLHDLHSKIGFEAKELERFLEAQTDPKRLPNVVFDGTLKNSGKTLEQLKKLVAVGYKPENIHLVWVVNSNQNSHDNNLARERSVPEDIRVATLKKSTETIVNILKGKDGISEYMNGNWYVVFSEFNAKSKTTRILNQAKNRRQIFADYVMVKRPNVAPDVSLVDKDALKRIADNLPWADFSDVWA